MNLNSHREEDTTEYELVEETTEQELFVHTHVDIDTDKEKKERATEPNDKGYE
jgi:hypothetical protein